MRAQVLQRLYGDLSKHGYHREVKSGGQTRKNQARKPVSAQTARSSRNAANGYAEQGTCLEDYRCVTYRCYY